ncbi:NEK, Kinase [Giardia lamblia P15]|uniref:NEK, Kinase n=1 Tax=Giardia intestinalis (strain P15) TaxID=658858 RepID=E1F0M2_GIAIA|nr:NEK, Kinase [Giardia lamblia P15]
MSTGSAPVFSPEKLRGRLGDVLRRDARGAVYSLRGCPYLAVKEIRLGGLDQHSVDAIRRGLAALLNTPHPGVLKYHQVLADGNTILAVTDRCCGDLRQFIADYRDIREPVPNELALSLLGQLADALAHLHGPSRGVYSDLLSGVIIEPGGVLFTGDGQRIVLGDLGLHGGTSSGAARPGDPAYMAPEALLRGATTPASDVWSLGAVAYELATLRKPDFLGGRDPAEAFAAGWSPDLSGVADGFVRSVLEKMLALDPAERPTARELARLLRRPGATAGEREAQDTRLKEARAAFAEALTRANDETLALERDPTNSAAKVDSIRGHYAIAAMLFKEIQEIKAEMGEPDEPDETEESEESNEPEEKHLIEEDDSTDLMRAVDRSDVEAVKALTPLQGGVKMKGCARVGRWNMYEGTSLMRAAVYGHAEIVELLAEKEEGLRDSNGWTALMFAAAHDHVPCVKLLLEKEGGMQCDSGWTALMSAAKHGYTDCLRLLLEKESGVQDNKGWTALMSAAKHGYTDCLRLLLEKESGVQDNKGWTALMSAAKHGYTDCLRLLLEKESGVQDNKGWTALMSAARHGHIDCLNLLLEREGGIQDNEGGTALMWAGQSGHADCVKLLMEKEGGIQGSNGWTALIVAAEHGKADCVELLLEKEGGLQKTDGTTALMWAAQNGHTSCVRLLADKEAGMQDNNGCTALMVAVRGGRVECVKLLMREKDLRDYSGWTALDVARRWRDHEIVALLSE